MPRIMSKADRRKQYEQRVKETVEANIKARCGADTKLPWTKRQRRGLFKIKDPVEQAQAWVKMSPTATHEVSPVSPMEADPKSFEVRLGKIEATKAVIGGWDSVLRWAKELDDDDERVEAYEKLMELADTMAQFCEGASAIGLKGTAIQLWKAIQRIKDSEAIEFKDKELD